ncbi:MAG: endonuclease/exonuclease/phosphatase family protein [Verrucomicrobiota bacterium]
MKQWGLVLWVLLLPLLGLGESLRVATYNLNNYLDVDRWVDGRYRKDYPKPESEKTALREVIRGANPDVLALQELGGPLHLEELRQDLKREGLDYPYSEIVAGKDDTRFVGLLSKVPFDATAHTNLSFKYFNERGYVRRGMLEARFGEGTNAWTLFVVHLKSRWTQRDDDPEAAKFRVGEAQAARNLIKKKYPPSIAHRYLVVGDLNDTKNSSTVKRFLKSGDSKLTELTETPDSRGERWTFHYRSEDVYERVDYILASPALLPDVMGGATYDAQPAIGVASDHRLLYVDLKR